MRLAFEVSYIGTFFCGSQQQIGKRTVMGEILRCLSELNLFSDDSTRRVAISGRTDKGVSAKRQVIAFDTEYPKRAVSAVNKKLPPDIRFTGWSEVSDDFNPRFSAKSRTYRYYFPDGISGIFYDADLMNDAASLFVGRHNFSSFSKPEGKNPNREILSSKIFREDEFLIFEICGQSFLWNMVRCISFCLEKAGRGEISADEIERALMNPSNRRFPAAPPEGLILWDVNCEIDFKPVNIHEKSIAFSNEWVALYSQLRKLNEIW